MLTGATAVVVVGAVSAVAPLGLRDEGGRPTWGSRPRLHAVAPDGARFRAATAVREAVRRLRPGDSAPAAPSWRFGDFWGDGAVFIVPDPVFAIRMVFLVSRPFFQLPGPSSFFVEPYLRARGRRIRS